MRLRSLTLQAVGPFAEQYTVDFDALAAGGLFLLEGPTGAGKSTIIDAVVFALYGKVASADASEDRLRSAYAGDDVESVVDLTFEVQAGTFRVRRTPAYQRAKRRGSGTTLQQASIVLWRVSPDGEEQVLATRLDEAGAELQRVVGLDRAQFVQTIVLPQGEFAKFLRADPEDRRGLLQRIFGTQVYDRIGQRLAELRREADRAVEAARAELAVSLAHVVGAARVSGEDAEAVTALVASPADAVRAELTTRASALVAQADAAARVAVDAQAASRLARGALDAAVELDGLLRRREALAVEASQLAGAAPQCEAARARVAAARSAQAVRPLLTAAEASRVAAQAARKDLEAACDAAPTDLAALAPDESALRSARDAALGEGAALEHWVRVEAGLVAARRAVQAARIGVEDLQAEVAAHDAWLARRAPERTELVTRLDAARALGALAAPREARVREIEAAAQRVLALDAARDELAAGDRAVREAAEVAREALEVETQLRAARIAGLAGELAERLSPGDACPVCGSPEHPHKARLGSDHVAAEQVTDAERSSKAAESALTQASAQVAALRERVAGLEEVVGSATAESVAAELVGARASFAEARAGLDEVAALEAASAAHDTETGRRRDERDTAAARTSAAEAQLLASEQALGADEAGVAGACEGFPTVAARHAAVAERADAAEGLAHALAAQQAAEAAELTRRVELDAALAEHGFPSADDAAAAWLEPADVAALARTVADFDAAVEANRRARADHAIAALAPDATVDLDAARAAEQAARTEADVASGAALLARELADATSAAVAGATKCAFDLEDARTAAAPVARLAGLASGTGGDNAHSLSLATYVLTRRFEDVVAAANDRLVAMSDGRFELARSDEKEDVSSRRRGLAMRVLDHRTEQLRDPRTLSGGETFYVSLCLALGMADVVTAEAGGIDLGTLFVDEGFGSLDPHTLDQVLVELGRLRAGGRVVGVVSHVEALKQSIADRIEVRPTADGPSRLTVRAG
ncbi:AAA family ATPase [Cellulomonas alba]|uniref:Nuclease SbcCD subunit C n=1 Tax=Cellulomonas alba TaxID=3053467 RepID=A0ABT7SFZ8_9CELL|nr:SMC family ATPase [Cellulomonas alba]MDM7855133.1 SMC family ATPase [Cellulomonas alba]